MPYGKGEGAALDVFSHSSMVAVGEIVDTIMLYWALPSKLCCKAAEHGVDTYALIWKITIWDMVCCARGERSETDWDGQPWPSGHPMNGKRGRICGDYFMAWFQFASDDEYLANYLHLPHWNNPSPCVFCSANDSDNPWTDFREGALWQQHLKSLAQWEASHADHPLWNAYLLIGLTAFHICIDELHNGALGILKNSLGSCIWVCVHFTNIPGSFSTRVSTVWSYVCRAYDELNTDHRLRVPYFKFLGVFNKQTSERPSDWPTLSGKAAHARHCLFALTKACDNIAHDYHVTSKEFKLQRYMLHRATKFYTILNEHGHYMSEEAGQDCFKNVRQFLQAQNALGKHYKERQPQLLLFPVTFKSHLMWHFGHSCQFFNPRCGWCYRDESFVGYIARVAKSVVAGLGAKRVALSLAKKWRWMLHLRMWQRERDN